MNWNMAKFLPEAAACQTNFNVSNSFGERFQFIEYNFIQHFIISLIYNSDGQCKTKKNFFFQMCIAGNIRMFH